MATWKVQVDWNGDADFSDASEDITGDVQDISWRLGMHKPYQNVADEATCTIKVRNTDGKYNPENTGGTLYNKIKPKNRVRVLHVSGTVETPMYAGFLQEIDVEWAGGPQAGKTSATMKVVGLKKYLDEQEFNVGLLRDKTADQIIERLLLYAPVIPVVSSMWVLGDSTYSVLGTTTIVQTIHDFADLETGLNTFEYFGDNSSHRNVDRAADGEKMESAYTMIKEVTEAERGRFFQARDGKATFWNRNHMPLATTVQGTVDTGTGSYKPRSLKYEYGTMFANNVEVIPHQRSEGALATLWTLDAPIEVRPGQKVIFNADFTDENGNECGADWAKVGSFEYTGGTVATGIKPLGKRAEITLDNSDPINGATVTTLTVEGPKLTSNNRLMAYADNQESIQTYGKTPALRLNLPALEDYEVAGRIARYEVRRRSTPRGEIHSLSFLNDSSDDSDTHQISWGIGTRIRVIANELSHDEEYFIMGEDHRIMGAMNIHQTTFYLEPAENNKLWVLGVSRLGLETVPGI